MDWERVMRSTEEKSTRPPEDLDEFVKWLESVDPGQLRRWLADAYWHRQIDDTEIRRGFLLYKRGVDMRTRPVSQGASPGKTNKSE
jgi:hypothetical protein